MKNIKLNTLLALVALGLLFGSCQKDVIPSGNVTTEAHSISNYTNLDISTVVKAYVKFSDIEESIEIEADDNLHEFVEVIKDGNTLKIRLKDKTSFTGNFTLNARIKTKNLNSFVAREASSIQLENTLETDQVSIEVSEASKFSGTINAESMTVELGEASNMTLAGSVAKFNIEAGEASQFGNVNFKAEKITAELKDASKVSLSVTDEIIIDASGASTLNYKGNPVIAQQSLSDASKINKIQ